jgi:cob(I)alamin adenosyltransferase
MRQGYVQVYTGDGKGKTTAALGVALRAAGAGMSVWFGQFLKCDHCSEHHALQRFADLVTVRQFGRPGFITSTPSAEDIALAREGLSEAMAVLAAGKHDVVILDEAACAVQLQLFDIDELLQMILLRPAAVELIITGRGAHPRLIEAADLVTEMRLVKHYYSQGVAARVGIEK